MTESRSYKNLKVWLAATDLAVIAYRLTDDWSPDERFGLISQVRRASVSVAANIAEGWGRQTPTEFVRFLLIANGSLKELETLFEIACRVGHVSVSSKDMIEAKCSDVGRMLLALIASIRSKKDQILRDLPVEYDSCSDLDESEL